MSQAPVWLITGCSSGFGIELVRIALAGGHRVVATSRTPSRTPDLVSEVEKAGGRWLQLDVADPAPHIVTNLVREVLDVFGRIDVLVNNAGTCLAGACEFLTDAQAKEQFETNFFGPLRLTQAVLPCMRAQRAGTIVNISSMAGISANPGLSMYAASKHALEAFSESLSKEVDEFGIKVLIVEPGNFRTNVLTSASGTGAACPVEYRGTVVDTALGTLKTNHGTQIGDPVIACQRIFEAVTRTGPFYSQEWSLRLMLGADAVARVQGKIDLLSKTINDQADIARSTAY